FRCVYICSRKRGEITIFYKYCGKRCIKLVSRSLDNPFRSFFLCPTHQINGGYGQMEWGDSEVPSKVEKKSCDLDAFVHLVNCTMEKLMLYEEKVRILEDKLEIEQHLYQKLNDELLRKIVHARCLIKCCWWCPLHVVFF
ncbi:hypothetical protein Leryth_025853, partial [Lithospermum erythrorhizon]